MDTIPKEYLMLFNTVTDTVKALEALRAALLEAQSQAEYLYITSGEKEAS